MAHPLSRSPRKQLPVNEIVPPRRPKLQRRRSGQCSDQTARTWLANILIFLYLRPSVLSCDLFPQSNRNEQTLTTTQDIWIQTSPWNVAIIVVRSGSRRTRPSSKP